MHKNTTSPLSGRAVAGIANGLGIDAIGEVASGIEIAAGLTIIATDPIRRQSPEQCVQAPARGVAASPGQQAPR